MEDNRIARFRIPLSLPLSWTAFVMWKYFLISLSLLFIKSGLFAQSFDYGNDWYKANPDRIYIKLIVEEDGIYRVTLQDLQNAGHDLSTVIPENLRLFYRGQEVPIYVRKSGSALSFIEFYGKRNDGKIDSMMYRDPNSGYHKPNLQPNKRISLFSDESAYFLTWDNVPSGNRYFSVLDPTYQLFTPEPFIRYEALKEYHPDDVGTRYVQGGGGPYDSQYTLNCDYGPSEGYVGPDFSVGRPQTISLETPLAANNNPVDVSMRVFGRSRSAHILRVEMNGDAGNPVLDTTINSSIIYVKTYKRSYNPSTSLTETTDLTFHALRSPTDNNQINLVSLAYNRLPDMNGDSAMQIVNWDKPGKAYLRLTNVNGMDTIYVYDTQNRFRNVGLISNQTADVIIQGFNNNRNLLVATDKAIKKPRIENPSLSKLYAQDQGAEYVIITNRLLKNSAEAYAQYRDTATVSPISSVKIVYVDQIYDEYSYGTITPWALKRFCKDALDNWTIKPKYFLLWGKGRYHTRNTPADMPLVPTFGYPATDYEFIAHFDQNSTEVKPQAAIGRINIFNDDEGFNYLAKVNDYEHTPWQEWMKNATFLGGGATLGEQNAISSAFNYIIDIFETEPFGGNPFYFQKNSAVVVIDPNSATYHDEISKGVSIIHFFGHSTSNILDVSLRDPFEYNNFSRYPLMIAMGCYGGDFTKAGTSFGESWVKQKDRGAIAYIGNSAAGYLNPLRDYGRVVYSYLHDKMLGQPIGDVLRTTLEVYTDSLRGIQYRNHGRQLNLQGDPAIILYNPEKPDLEVTETSVYFTPDNFTAQDDSFRINVIVDNLGLVESDSFRMTIKQRLPNNSVILHELVDLPLVANRDTFSYMLNNEFGNAMAGQNLFEIVVDVNDSIDEYLENNNVANVSKIIPGNVPAILSPYEYAVVGQNQVTLQASALFMTRDEGVGYIFEIDTTSTFDSPGKINSGVVLGKSVFAAWDVPFNLQDSTVYYWRVRLSDVTPGVWANSSFKYIANQSGWAQARLPQFNKDELNKVQLDEVQKQWKFSTFARQFEFVVGITGGFFYSVNGFLTGDLNVAGFELDGVGFVIFDQLSLEPKTQSLYGPMDGVAAPNELYLLKNAILSANTGDYVVVAGHRNPHVPQWSEDVFEVLKLIGASDNIRLLKDGESFLILGRKGYPNSATEILSPSSSDKYVLDVVLEAPYDEGTINSTRIGPALAWHELFWDWETVDPLNEELMTVSVYGVRADDTDSLLIPDLTAGLQDLSAISSDEFPYMELRASLLDTLLRTAPQLDNWHVLFDPAPDAIVDPTVNFTFRSDTLFEGQDAFIHMAARNISGIDMDSVKVKLTLEREDRSRLILDSMMIAPLLSDGQPIEFEYEFSTFGKNLDGNIDLLVEINPNGEQPEKYYFNNLYVQPFLLVVDRQNPLMDVTFDGKHILEGDIVSPDPEILIEVNDENPYITLSDSSTFELYFMEGTTSPGIPRIFIDDQFGRVQFVPAQLPENKAQLFFYPGRGPDGPLADGEYTLRVQGRDKKGNPAGLGDNFYEIHFNVESESRITHLLNYPNPFSTATRFVYTLTGMELPEVFQIHIYTISGKLVKVVDLVELGEVNFGRNITTYAWDGRDEYGDLLANGVYIYKTVIKMPNEPIELREEGIEKYFNNGWGKMYIMR